MNRLAVETSGGMKLPNGPEEPVGIARNQYPELDPFCPIGEKGTNGYEGRRNRGTRDSWQGPSGGGAVR